MAEDKPRAPRARKKTSETDTAATKAAAKKKPTTTARRRKLETPVTEPEYVAVRAYYLWEKGEPGDSTEHWLRAELELAAA
jgi:hypothetical protein